MSNKFIVELRQIDIVKDRMVIHDLDDVADGTIYGKVKITELASGEVTRLRGGKVSVDTNGNLSVEKELKIKLYIQTSEPVLNADEFCAFWKDDDNKIYLVFRRGVGDQVSVELG